MPQPAISNGFQPVQMLIDKVLLSYLNQDEDELWHLAEMAYKTCLSASLTPCAILIRSKIHDTTTIWENGSKIEVDDDWHITISVKDKKYLDQHTTYHGYVKWENSTDIHRIKQSIKKPDFTRTGSRKKPIWPASNQGLYELKPQDMPDLSKLYDAFWEM